MMLTVLDSLTAGLHGAMRKDERVLLLGEDILDPYGGAFKVTRGCSTAFPDRVLTTPISEAGLAGFCGGLALRELRPVLEIMFGDFTTLLADQLINHITKFRWMYNNTVSLPLVIRTPMGGRRGYGPTHSQTIEKHFLGVPGLKVLAPVHFTTSAHPQPPGELLESAILITDEPVLFIENKLQYLLPLIDGSEDSRLDVEIVNSPDGVQVFTPVYRVTVKGAPAPQVSLAAYGYMAELGRQALLQLAYEDEIFAEMMVVTQLSPYNTEPLMDSLSRTRKLVVLEEGGKTLGWGAELIARVVEDVPGITTTRVAARDLPVPAAPSLEKAVLPQLEDILGAVRKVVNQ